MNNLDRIAELERQIAQLVEQWPAHSIPPAMLQKLDELEEELAQLKADGRLDTPPEAGEHNSQV